MVIDQVLRTGREIIKDILLPVQISAQMPGLAILRTSTNVGDNQRVALIWSDRVNRCEWRDFLLLLSLLSLFFENRASSSQGSFQRRLISLIFAGRNRIILIRRELPLTVIASSAEPVA